MASSGEMITFAEYEASANRAAHLLRSEGLRHADHIAMLMDNDPRMLVCEGGAERTGLYYTCINSHLTAEEAAYIINDCEAQIVLVSANRPQVAPLLPEMCPDVRRWLLAGRDDRNDGIGGPFEDWDGALAEMSHEPVEHEMLGTPMLYSSGTTGRPKGILRPLPEMAPSGNLPMLDNVKFFYRLREGMTYLSPAPLYHSAPQASVAAALRLGATSVVMEHFDPGEFLELVARHRVTHTQMVPTMFSRLLKLPVAERDQADTSSLEVVIHAAAPCPVEVKEQMIEWLGPIIYEYYSCTEGNGFTFCDTDEWLAHRGTVGRPLVGEVLILDEEGRECPRGEPGTVWFKGNTSFEYFKDPIKTSESKNEDGDASTVGDVGYLDADGYLYLTDRKTYMIISGGVNIYPQETENLLITHPKVFDAAVIGVPDQDLGESVKAVVQPISGVAGGPQLEAELIAFCRARLAHFKCPRSVDFTDELPRQPTGKLYKRLLRDEYWSKRRSNIV